MKTYFGKWVISLWCVLICLMISMPRVGHAKALENQGDEDLPNAQTHEQVSSEQGKPGLYIIRLADPPLAAYQGGTSGLSATHPRTIGKTRLDTRSSASNAYRKYLSDKQDEVMAFVEETIGPSHEPVYRYDVAYNGMALRLTPEEAEEIAKLPEVVSVQPDKLRQLATDASPAFINADEIWKGIVPVPGSAQEEDKFPGTKGEGIILGIIDSGVWPEHPSFADDGTYLSPPLKWGGKCTPPADGTKGYACNNKLIGMQFFLKGYEAKTGTYDGLFQSGRDDSGHGTHIASIAAGNETVSAHIYGIDRGKVSGIAPRAHIAAYKASGPAGSAISDILAAIDKAIADGVDVISYSIGSDNADDPWTDPDALAFLAAHDAGVFVTISAGNKGPKAGTIGSPGNAPWVTTVGASCSDRLFLSNVFVEDAESSIFEFYGASPTRGIGDFNLVDAQGIADIEGDASGSCLHPFPTGTFRSTDAVLCKRGTVTTSAKGNFVQDGGGGALVLYNDEGSYDLPSFPYPIPTVLVLHEIGLELKDIVKQNRHGSLTIRFGQGEPVFAPDPRVPVDTVLGFSSRGPAISDIKGVMDIIKPDLVAPGIHILAGASPEWVADINDDVGRWGHQGELFQIIQGTSMSSPAVAGAGILLRSLHPEWTPAQIRSALMTTAASQGQLARDASGDHPADPFDLGAGRVDVSRAAQAGFVLDETADNFMTADPARRGDPSVLNLPSLTNAKCMGECKWTRTLESTAAVPINWTVSILENETRALTSEHLTANPPSFILEPGKTQKITITANVTSLPPDEWAFAEVCFVPEPIVSSGKREDNAQFPVPASHFPVAVRPIASISPVDEVEIETRRNQGVFTLEGLRSLGTDHLSVNAYFNEPEITEASVSQDSANDDVYDDLNDGLFITLLDVPDRAKALTVSIEAESNMTDVDLYVGIDENHDGVPSEDEQRCKSTTPFWYETCQFPQDGETMETGTYWIMVQNWERTELPEDKFSLSTTIIGVDTGTSTPVTAVGPENVVLGEPYGIEVSWNFSDIQEGDTKEGWLEIGTDPDHPGNIISMPMRISRIEDDVSIRTDSGTAHPGDIVTCTLHVQPDTIQGDVINYTLRNTLPEGMTYIPGSATIAPDEINGNELVWFLRNVGEYRMSTNQDDLLCDAEYVNLEEYGILPTPEIAGDGIIVRYDEHYGGFDPVSFFGNIYADGLYLTDDGFALMEPDPGDDPGMNAGIPHPALPNGLIAPFWRDMEIVYDKDENRGVTLAGTPDDIKMVIEYDGIEPAPAGSTDERFNFEIIMRRLEDDTPGAHEIVFAYEDMSGSAMPGTIGIEDAGGRRGLQYAYDDAQLEDGLVICFDWVHEVHISYQARVDEDILPQSHGISPPVSLSNRVEHTAQAADSAIIWQSSVAKTSVTVAETPVISLSSGEIFLPIPDNGEASAFLEISKKAAVRKASIILNISHPYPEDVSAVLMAPSGKEVTLFEHMDAEHENVTDITIGDESVIVTSTVDFLFYGEPTEGPWTLKLYDGKAWDEGMLLSWGLEIRIASATPIANLDMATIGENKPVSIDVLANDIDPDGDELAVMAVSVPSHGMATHDGKTVTYTSEPGFMGGDIFTYTITDNSDGIAQGTVFVTVEGKDATLIVSTSEDEVVDDGKISLREAIMAANTDQSVDGSPQGGFQDTIILPAGTFALGSQGTLDIVQHLNLIGTSNGETILRGNGNDRVIRVHEGAEVRIENMTIQNGGTGSFDGQWLTEDRPPWSVETDDDLITTSEHEFAPWLVALASGEDDMAEAFCTGTLVHPEWVLTAAHCVSDKNEDAFDVVLNASDGLSHAFRPVETDGIIIHPAYDPRTMDSDIALVRLSEPCDQPWMDLIPPGDPRGIANPGTLARAMAWNMENDYDPSFWISVPIVSNETAQDALETMEEAPYAMTESMMAAGYDTEGSASCTGDDGSPLVVPVQWNHETLWVQAGIFSWGEECVSGKNYGVHTRVSAFTDWIYDQIGGMPFDEGLKGGAILNEGDLTLSRVTLTENTAGTGGAICNDGTLTLTNSTLSHNSAQLGGGLYNGGIAQVIFTTIAENTALRGGGIFSADTWHTLLPENEASVTLRNTLNADNAAAFIGSDLAGTVISQGVNLIGDSTGGHGYQDEDLLDTNPLLVPLVHNGGPTPTHAIQVNGPAVDAGDCMDIKGNIVETDQRGVTRRDPCDIGAFEYDGNAYPPVAVDDIVFTNERSINLNVLANDRDANGDDLTLFYFSPAEYGRVTEQDVEGTGSSLTYTPNQGVVGTDSFFYVISDGDQISEAIVHVTNQPNNMPIIQNDNALTHANTRVTIDVLDNDSDPENDVLTVADLTQPLHGAATINGTTIIYEPNKDFVGTDTFMYRVTDGLDTGKAVVTVTVGDLAQCHHADHNPPDYEISLSELLRVIQLYTNQAYQCGDPQIEDGYEAESKNPELETQDSETCLPHHSDYNPQDWRISLSELLRLIQFYTASGYHLDPNGEDGFAPGK